MSLFKKSLTAQVNEALAAAVTAPVTLPQPVGLGGGDIVSASSALTADLPTPIPNMVRPFLGHQVAAFVYCIASVIRWGACLLGDDMGMGKTQVLFAAIAERLRVHGGYAIMVAPPVAKAGYMGDLQAAFPHLRMVHLQGRKVVTPPPADIYFISDDTLTLKAWLTDEVQGRNGKVLVASPLAANATIVTRDEIHRDKGNLGKPTARAKVMLAVGEALRQNNRPIIGATGTLLTNRPVEAFVPLQILGGDALVKAVTPGAKGKSGFLYRYCDPSHNGFGTDFKGASRTDELHHHLRATIYVRREKRDLGEGLLPHAGWLVTPIALNGVLKRYEALEDDLIAVLRDEKGPEAAWKAARAEVIVQMMALWAEAGVAKAKAAAEYIENLVQQGRKVVAFYYHTDVMVAMARNLTKYSSTIIKGGQSPDERAAVINAFQAGDHDICFAQIRAAGMAVTLTAAADAVFVQVPWSAGDLKQAADRILRVDDRTMQRAKDGETITWHVLQACKSDGKPTFDAVMWKVLENKAQVIDAVNAGKAITMPEESLMYETLTEWYAQA